MKDSRQSIIDATERLLQSQGLARLTTREIAREADVAEGLIYHHFGNKANLIFKVVERRMLPTNNAVKSLPLQVGLRTVRKNLEDMLMVVYCNHYETAPIASSMFADQHLREQLREIMKEGTSGPQNDIKGLAAYLAAEQRLGRVANTVDPQITANCLWKIFVQTSMDDFLMGRKSDAIRARKEIRRFLQILMLGLKPRPLTEKTVFKKGERS